VTTSAVSLVVTVRDEGASIASLLASIAAQTRPPDEIVIVDGGSTDDTVAVLERWRARLPLQVLVRPGANISAGRNAGIAAARGAIVAVTDAGVRLAPDWLASLVAPFEAVAAADAPAVVAGFFAPDPQTPFETAMGATVLPTLADVEPATFLPSSRSIAFRRAAWARVGGYPEWLDYCEDLVFDLALRETGTRSSFAPGAVAHFRPRGSLRVFWQQYFRYARGDGKAGLFARRHAIRYATYAGFVLFLLRGRRVPLLWPLALLGGVAYVRRPYARLLPWLGTLTPRGRAQATALVPVIRLVGDLAKMAGYPVGLLWRWRRYGWRGDWRTIGAEEGKELAGPDPATDQGVSNAR
jgi:glycosyltransferase involved in cell wall biosynthesis